MKKIYLSLLSVTAALSMNAQLTQANHAPAAGDAYNTTTYDGVVSPGGSGAGQTWNYSSITTTVTSPLMWNATTNSNASYAAANVRVSSTANDNLYYESTAANLKYYGGDLNVGGIPVTLTYTSPATVAVYPMNLSTTSNNLIGGSLSAAGTNGTFSGTCQVTADATGTLTLPGKSFNNVMRVNTMQDIRIDVPFVVSNGTLTQVNYEYYQVGFKQPMFTISTSTLDAPPLTTAPNTGTVLTVFSDYLTVGVNETSLTSNNVVVYPNPASSNVNFVSLSNEAMTVKLFSLTGSLVKEVSGTEALNIDLNDLQSGLYIYSLTSGKETVSGKIAVTH